MYRELNEVEKKVLFAQLDSMYAIVNDLFDGESIEVVFAVLSQYLGMRFSGYCAADVEGLKSRWERQVAFSEYLWRCKKEGRQ